MSDHTTTIDRERTALRVLRQTIGYCVPAALRAMCRVRVADHLADGPKTLEELASLTECDAHKLFRVLRVATSHDILSRDEDGRYHLTEAGDLLRSDAPMSLREGILLFTSEALWNSTRDLTRALRGTESVFDQVYGSIWDFWRNNLQEEDDFNAGMASWSAPEVPSLLRTYDFPERGTIVDVGGGNGNILLEILKANPGLHGILYDQAHVVPNNILSELGDDSRWETASGDFFREAPAGADIYFMKHVVQDWDDERATLILRACRKAMKPDSRVVINDPYVSPDDEPCYGKDIDMMLMAVIPGLEREQEEYRELLANAGLRRTRVIPLESGTAVIEAVPA
jgi:hypothetical protein